MWRLFKSIVFVSLFKTLKKALFVAVRRTLAPHTVWACMLSLLEPLGVNQTVTATCNVNGAVVAASSWSLTWLASVAIFLLLLASCLPAPSHCFICGLHLVCMLHSNCCRDRRFAEQASLIDGRCGAKVETASCYTKSAL